MEGCLGPCIYFKFFWGSSGDQCARSRPTPLKNSDRKAAATTRTTEATSHQLGEVVRIHFNLDDKWNVYKGIKITSGSIHIHTSVH